MMQTSSINCSVVLGGGREMGLPMVRRLLSAGINVRGLDIRPHEQFLNAGLTPKCDLSESRRCDVLISVVSDASETDELCLVIKLRFLGRATLGYWWCVKP